LKWKEQKMGTVPEQGLTFEKVWAAIQATNEQMKETDRRLAETGKLIDKVTQENALRMAEADRRRAEIDRRMAETDRQMKETDKRIGALGKRFGEVVEYMVVPNLIRKFGELGFVFTRVHQNTKIEDDRHNIYAEVDAFMENGDRVMIIETKTKPSIEDIKDHIEHMGKHRAYADLHNDKRKYLGAIAGVVVSKNVKDYALKNGLYVLEPSGDTFDITAPEGSPREW
jgi:predicted RNase H-related nuclease YkuK (DUF458 family)